ncbi:myelin regulatory factor-like protein isoform X2 [Myxocyprinus asiaticus]|uniref:myelin regulatory factor-like protein isoform X2 n=1 Tax=Myxocyprinus asiaticus TaxID=70543 RepID=UPI0022235DB0|nr:myelin regulatory factor-like protein isoform X2 [Myxocyprinus asiaticus]
MNFRRPGEVPMDVLGENEALQQFFNGQDVSGVLESAVVDTSILEQYLSNETDTAFMLPDSPPDSGSEHSSPPRIPDSRWSTEHANQDTYSQSEHSLSTSSPFQGMKQECCGCTGQERTYGAGRTYKNHIKASSPALVHISYDSCTLPQCVNTTESYIQANASNNPPNHGVQQLSQGPQMGLPGGHNPVNTSTVSLYVPHATCPETVYMTPKHDQHLGNTLHENKKRTRSNSFDGNTEQHRWAEPVWVKPSLCSDSGTCEAYDSDVPSGSPVGGVHQLLSWDRYQPSQWCSLCNNRFETLPPPGYHVDTDKGFSYSTADEAFVCQKKNHFQVTVHIGMVGDPRYVETAAGPMPVENFHVKVFGIKLEAQNHFITIEQSQSDRSKKPFLPVKVNLPGDKITKVTLGRLHFSETTSNNMRKKGKPNPDQRYFLMVVGLYATVKEEHFLLVANVSERIIVRASNPGQFENDSDVLWQRGHVPESVVHHGKIGINTDSPDEALVVCGNAKIMGNIMHPSDKRAKHNIQEVDSTEQLKRITQMRIVEYDYKPEFASRMGIDQVHETGIIAQEVKELLPSAVKEMGDITCVNGEKIDHFLMVDKEQIFMENVGAVKQLCKLTDNLETRIQELEVWNTRLAKLKTLGSMRSNSGSAAKGYEPGKINKNNKTHTKHQKPSSPLQSNTNYICGKYHHCLQHKVFQASVIMLVTTMALSVISITALYMLTVREDVDFNNSLNNTNVNPLYTTTATLSTGFSTAPPAPWPPDIDFSNVFYSDDIFCCPANLDCTHSTKLTDTNTRFNSPSPVNTGNTAKVKWLDKLPEKMINSSDWTNTSIQSILITQNQQVIDQQYCQRENCGKGNYSYHIPLSKHTPPNMPITLQMNTTELLVVHLCSYDEREQCSSVLDYNGPQSHTALNTQGYIHKWTLAVANHYRASYNFRSSVAGLADCNTDPNYAEVLFTDYHFQFYRRCD